MSTDRQATLKRLLRAIALSVGDFALLLARCNSIEVRDRLVADLKAQLGSGLYDRHVTDADGVVNLVDILDEVGEGTQVINVTGLEASPHLHDILALANNAREEFRKRFKFPLVLWVTDEVEAELRRRSPDLASWAAPPFDFALDRAELQAMLERETADVLDWAFAREGKRGIGQELQWAWQEWQRLEENRSPELAAKVALAFGIEAGSGDAAREHFENCLAQVSTGSLAAAARYRLGLWWQLRGKQERVNFGVNCDRAREQLQRAWQEAEGKQVSVALALGEILLALALPETGTAPQWEALANFANELVILPDWAAGLRAEVAIARQDWQVAKNEAEKALQRQERQGFYLLSLGRSLIGMDRAKEAIAHLERAKALVLPEVDPDLHIRILQALHRAYTAVENYRDAFTVKFDRESVETSYGFRAFIGAGRLQPQRRVGAIGEDAMEEVAASGRQADIEALVDRVKRSDCRLTVVHGPSGVGKSSLLQSGLVPALRKVIHQSRSVQPVVIEHYEDWQGELASKLGRSPLAPLVKGGKEEEDLEVPLYKGDLGGSELHKLGRSPLAPLVKGGKEEDLEVPLFKGDLGGSESLIAQLRDRDRQNLITVLIFDQFEEFFFKHTEVPDRRKLYDFLRECLNVANVWVILSLREDYIHYLLECDRLANIELINNDILNKNVRYYLGNFSKERAKAVIKELTERSPYRLEESLVDRLVADLAAEFGEVRPIELQVVGAQMLHGESKITTLAAYEGLGKNPKRALVEGWLMQVVRDCGQENEELAQRVLYALTEEPEKRPAKTRTELQRDVFLDTPELAEEQRDFAVQGDLDFVLTVPIGSGLAFEIPASPETCYQLIHDYLVLPIRQQFGGNLERQLEEERKKRKAAEENLRKRNRLLLRGSIFAVVVVAAGIIASIFALQKDKIAETNKRNMDTFLVSLKWKQLMDKKIFSLEEQITTIEETKRIQSYFNELTVVSRLELISSLHQASVIEKEKSRFEGHQDPVSITAFAPDSKSFVTVSKDNIVRLWGIDGELVQIFQETDEVKRVAFAPDGKSFLTGSVDKTANLWRLDGKLLQTFQGEQSTLNSLAFAPDSKSILISSFDGAVKLWKLGEKSWKIIQDKQEQSSLSRANFASDGKSIMLENSDGKRTVRNLEGKILDEKIDMLSDNDYSSYLSFEYPFASNSKPKEVAPNGRSMLILSEDRTIKLWSSRERKIRQRMLVNNVVFTPDSKYLLGYGRGAILLSLDGKLQKDYREWRVNSVTFSPDGKSLITIGARPKLWGLDGKLQKTYKEWGSMNSVNFSADGKSLMTMQRGDNRMTEVKLWDLDGKLQKNYEEWGLVNSVTLSPDGKNIMTIDNLKGENRLAKLWNLDGELLQTYEKWGSVLDIIFSPDGKNVLTRYGEYGELLEYGARRIVKKYTSAKLWDMDGKLLQTYEENGFSSIDLAPDGKSVITGNKNGIVKLWSLDGKLLQNFQADQSDISSVAFAPDGKSILTWSSDKIAKLWSLDGKLLHIPIGKDKVSSIAFSPVLENPKDFGNKVLTGGADGQVKLWGENKKLLQTFQAHISGVSSIAFAPDGQSLLTGSWDKTAKLWSLDGQLLQIFQVNDKVNSIAFAPDGKSVLTGNGDKTAKLWSLDGRLLQTFQGHKGEVIKAIFSPDGKKILTSSWDNTAKLWSFDGQLLQSFQEDNMLIDKIAFSPDSKKLLAGNWSKVYLWSVDGQLLQTFVPSPDILSQIDSSINANNTTNTTNTTFAPDGNSILIEMEEGKVNWWSLDGRLLEKFQVQSQVLGIAFAPDGKSIIVGSSDEIMKRWDLDLGHSLSLLCEHLQEFASGSSKPNIPYRDLRERARKACENIPPPSQ